MTTNNVNTPPLMIALGNFEFDTTENVQEQDSPVLDDIVNEIALHIITACNLSIETSEGLFVKALIVKIKMGTEEEIPLIENASIQEKQLVNQISKKVANLNKIKELFNQNPDKQEIQALTLSFGIKVIHQYAEGMHTSNDQSLEINQINQEIPRIQEEIKLASQLENPRERLVKDIEILQSLISQKESVVSQMKAIPLTNLSEAMATQAAKTITDQEIVLTSEKEKLQKLQAQLASLDLKNDLVNQIEQVQSGITQREKILSQLKNMPAAMLEQFTYMLAEQESSLTLDKERLQELQTKLASMN